MRNSATPEQSHLKAKLLVALIIFCSIGGTLQAQVYPEMPPETTAEAYSESALRRFEVICLVSLPFTTVHSYLAVRGIKIIEQGTIAAELSDTDYKIIGASAVAFSLFIGFWDWLHTHDESPSQPKMPSPTAGGRQKANLSLLSTVHFPLPQVERSDTPQGYFVPLFQVRF